MRAGRERGEGFRPWPRPLGTGRTFLPWGPAALLKLLPLREPLLLQLRGRLLQQLPLVLVMSLLVLVEMPVIKPEEAATREAI